MLKLKLQYFGHLMWRAGSLEKTLLLGKIEGRRRRQQTMRWLDDITNSMDMSLNKLVDSERQRNLACCSPWGHRVRCDWTSEQWHRFPGGSDGKKSACSMGDLIMGWEDPLEKEMATLSSILAWRTPWTEEPGLLKSMGSQRHDWVTNTFILSS